MSISDCPHTSRLDPHLQQCPPHPLPSWPSAPESWKTRSQASPSQTPPPSLCHPLAAVLVAEVGAGGCGDAAVPRSRWDPWHPAEPPPGPEGCSLTSVVTASGTRVWNSHNTSHAIWLQQGQHREHMSGTWSKQSDFSNDSIGNTCLEHSHNTTCSLTSATTALGTQVWNTVTSSHAVWLQQWQHWEHKSGTQSQHHMQSDFSNNSIRNTQSQHVCAARLETHICIMQTGTWKTQSEHITCSLISAVTLTASETHLWNTYSHSLGTYLETSADPTHNLGTYLETSADPTHNLGTYLETSADPTHNLGTYLETSADPTHNLGTYLETSADPTHNLGTYLEMSAEPTLTSCCCRKTSCSTV